MKTLTCIRLSLLLCCFSGGSGCTTFVAQQRMDAVRRESEIERLSADVAKLKERVEALAVTQQQLYQQMDGLQASVRDDNARVRQALADMDHAVKSLDESQKSSRQELEDTMTKRLPEILSRTPAAAPSQRVERGYEHVVQAGQTLSEIAAAYKVKPQDIIKANKLQNANTLRVGQKLFIPE